MTTSQARAAIAILAKAYTNQKENLTRIDTPDDSYSLSGSRWEKKEFSVYDSRSGKEIEADLSSSRFYANYGSDSQKILISHSGSSFDAEDRENSKKYSGRVSGDDVTLTDQNTRKEYKYRVR